MKTARADWTRRPYMSTVHFDRTCRLYRLLSANFWFCQQILTFCEQKLAKFADKNVYSRGVRSGCTVKVYNRCVQWTAVEMSSLHGLVQYMLACRNLKHHESQGTLLSARKQCFTLLLVDSSFSSLQTEVGEV